MDGYGLPTYAEVLREGYPNHRALEVERYVHPKRRPRRPDPEGRKRLEELERAASQRRP